MRPSLAQFFELSIDMLCVADTTGYFRVVNPAFTESLGWTAEELLAQPFVALVHPDDRASTEAELDKLRGGLATIRFENRFQAKDGGWVWFAWTCRPEPESGLLYAVARDVTSDKLLADSLVRARDEAERANLAKSQFLTAMSHELRTPLNAIIGYSEMLVEDADELGLEKMSGDLQRIREAGRHLLDLINQVLDLSRVEAGRMEVEIAAVDLDALVDSVAKTIAPLAERQHNRFHLERAGTLGTVATDTTKLKQILLNLLGNACKFTRDGEVRLTAARDATGTRFTVTDDGVGIAPQDLERVFEPFNRGGGGRTHDFSGTGLGLPLSRHFAQLIGGTLSVTSAPGRGSTFSLSLAHTPTSAGAGLADRGEIHTTVLVVDDDPDARRLLELVLERGGHRVVTAASGDEGLAMARRLRPGAILLDLVMPGRDGWAALAAFQADPQLARTPVIIVSAVDARDIGFALGVDGYVTKPVDRALLLSAVERALDRGARLGPILVVEDDADARELLVRALVAQGHQVVEARDGEEGLRQLERYGAALIVLDLIMPNLDGFELAERVRGDARWNDVPIVVVSAADPSAAELARLDGKVLDVLSKGVSSTDALLQQIQRLLAGSAPTRPAVPRPKG
ncbi:MAG: hybrid sensor histidine kinase/response regulator [Deltaproteobacteria bacterium HGW-Deltaproteobacteria-14]|jgi:hypothetical protein|nr:MAG: hybrid sensor histidine kinase/response regulator [Deltaproteobacteria bacterium HGW-Deltaproteobacteria-14]